MSGLPVHAGLNSPSGPMPYPRLATSWWKWALQTPSSQNPLLDTTGEFCAVNQTGDYWFLAGNFGGADPMVRNCKIPAAKSLFFPVVNTFYGAFLTDPAKTKSIPYMRNLVGGSGLSDCIISATLDANPVSIVYEKSIPFVVRLPDDNVFGLGQDVVKNMMVSPMVDEGYYVLLDPLAPGAHQIHFDSLQSGNCPVALDVTYDIIVE